MKVLITGGAGFIGSTIASACLDAGITPVLLDDLSTGRSEFMVGREAYVGDVADRALLDQILDAHGDIVATVHCAAKVVVPESVADPLGYYRTNVAKTVELVDCLQARGVDRFVFSSSASIYRPDDDLTVDEDSALEPSSPYARSKAMVEQVLADAAEAYPLRVISLRYFNPIGADPQLRTGLQAPAPSHALGKLLQAYERGERFTITGTSWATRDGTGLRDYIHVWDLARAHVAALQRFDQVVTGPHGYSVVNLGTGRGTTVRELVAAFESVVGESLDVDEAEPRPGDVIGCCTRSDKAARLLGWRSELSEADGVRDALAWARRRREVLGS
ncbi:MAG: UDP-glucose 4-epimerase GalE [Nocardioidaceae bacterium]|nr:UDP-glucose 4-epimerase GalE [Nocardioidaceae bacterium]